MKVLSLIEPYATLIVEKKKKIETRSWKTNYRGELYIHASLTKMAKEDKENKNLMGLIDNKNLNYGAIVCKCNLKDCIYMTKEWVNQIKKENPQEYLCGDYQEGRYAWILENLEPLKDPIQAKGHLGIWNYLNECQLMDLMDNIEYGWLDKENKKCVEMGKKFLDNYRLASPKEVLQNKVGICWDQVELERYYLSRTNWKIKTFCLIYKDGNNDPTHTFITFEKKNKFYWFEHAWDKCRGMHEYTTLKKMLKDVELQFIKIELKSNVIKQNLLLYEYRKPKSHLNCQEFYDFCQKGKLMNLE